MHIQRGLTQYKILVPIVILMVIFSLAINDAEAIVLAPNEGPIYEMPIYEMPISESTQHYIWDLCEEKEFPYELILSIYEVEGFGSIKLGNIKSDIETLVYYRGYWAKQGYPDEFVFNLILISRLRGIEGCRIFMKHTESYDLNDYVQAVVEYKFYLEQSLDEASSVNKPFRRQSGFWFIHHRRAHRPGEQGGQSPGRAQLGHLCGRRRPGLPHRQEDSGPVRHHQPGPAQGSQAGGAV